MKDAILSTASLSVLVPIGSALLAVASSPSQVDTWAAVGAGLATLIAVAEARQKDRSILNMACVVVGSWFIGATGPAVAIQLFNSDLYNILSWHAWSLMGFSFGLVGWPIGYAVYRLGPTIGDALTRRVMEKIGIEKRRENDRE